MRYLKSFVAGVFAVITYLILLAVVVWFFMPRPRLPEGEGAVVSLDITRPSFLAGAVLVFVAVCYWTFKHASARSSK